MKSIFILVTVILLVFAPVGFAEHRHIDLDLFDGELWEEDGIRVCVDDGSVILTHEYEDDEIEITDDYELYINDRPIKTDARQRELVQEYHTTVFGIKDRAVEIGLKGAKIGLEGAKIGLQAIGGVFKMILTSYDEDDLDRDMDRATREIEYKAELLEDEAEEIEEMADDIEDIWYDMQEEIPEIGALGW